MVHWNHQQSPKYWKSTLKPMDLRCCTSITREHLQSDYNHFQSAVTPLKIKTAPYKDPPSLTLNISFRASTNLFVPDLAQLPEGEATPVHPHLKSKLRHPREDVLVIIWDERGAVFGIEFWIIQSVSSKNDPPPILSSRKQRERKAKLIHGMISDEMQESKERTRSSFYFDTLRLNGMLDLTFFDSEQGSFGLELKSLCWG